MPHLTVLLDVSPEAARERFTEAPDRLESEPAEFHARVRSGFLTLAAADPGRYLVVDAAQEPEAVTTVVRHRLDVMLPLSEAEVKAQEEARKAAEEEARRKAEEEAARKAEEERLERERQEQLARLRAEEEERKQRELEEAQRREAERQAEEARQRAEEARRRAEEERARLLAEEQARAAEQERLRRQAAEEARLRAEAEERRLEKQRKAEEALAAGGGGRRRAAAAAAAAAARSCGCELRRLRLPLSAGVGAAGAVRPVRRPTTRRPCLRRLWRRRAGRAGRWTTRRCCGRCGLMRAAAVRGPAPGRVARSGCRGSDAEETATLPKPPVPEGLRTRRRCCRRWLRGRRTRRLCCRRCAAGAADETAVLPPVASGAADETAVLPPVRTRVRARPRVIPRIGCPPGFFRDERPAQGSDDDPRPYARAAPGRRRGQPRVDGRAPTGRRRPRSTISRRWRTSCWARVRGRRLGRGAGRPAPPLRPAVRREVEAVGRSTAAAV